MNIDLDREMRKVTEESERTVSPSETVERAAKILRSIGIELDFNLISFDDVFWTSCPDVRFLTERPPFFSNIRMGGKGPSEEQCKASTIMEFVERWSFMKNKSNLKEYYDCYDLRERKYYRMAPIQEFQNTMCLASGNNYEEAILHCLHELIETRTPIAQIWKPCRTVEIKELIPELPDWINETILLIQVPTEYPELYKFIAVQYPFNGEFEDEKKLTVQKTENRIRFFAKDRDPNKHSPNSGGAAGINPQKTAFRAMNEIFQFQNPVEDYKTGRKKEQCDFIQRARKEDFINFETGSITGDIRKILDLLPEDVFIGVVDFTDPELDVPVVKILSNYDPVYSLVSKRNMNVFFDY